MLAARSTGGLNEVAAQVTAAGGNSLVIPTDVGDPAAAEQLVQQTLQAFGRIDAAFNNLAGAPGMAAYAAGKHAIIGLTETAALDNGKHGVRVNAIAPGPIPTHNLARADDAARARIADHIPVHRLGRPKEVAAIAVWLCSDQASFINGATVPIDGGKLAGSAALLLPPADLTQVTCPAHRWMRTSCSRKSNQPLGHHGVPV